MENDKLHEFDSIDDVINDIYDDIQDELHETNTDPHQYYEKADRGEGYPIIKHGQDVDEKYRKLGYKVTWEFNNFPEGPHRPEFITYGAKIPIGVTPRMRKIGG